MTRTVHDSFAKEWMQEVLADFGEVEIEAEISGTVRTLDILFRPNAQATEAQSIAAVAALGLLGRMTEKICGIEAFRNAVPEWEIRNCRGKIFDLEGTQRRQAIQRKQKLSEIQYPSLWILSPTLSKQLQKTFTAQETKQWGKGIYFLTKGDRTAIIAIHQLPKTLDTLWLRLLGRGTVQRGAVKELMALPSTHPYRQEALQHLTMLQVRLKARHNKTRDIKEVVMNLSPVYEEWRQKTLDEGRVEGRDEGRDEGRVEERRSLALKMLQGQFDLTVISQLTELSIEQLQTLQQPSQS
jgi:hypothetical protein